MRSNFFEKRETIEDSNPRPNKIAKTDEDSNSDMIAAFKYQVRVCEGTMDFIHGGGHFISEIYVPSYQLCFNSEAAFQINAPRNKSSSPFTDQVFESPLVEVQVPKTLVQQAAKIAQLDAERKEVLNAFKNNPDCVNLCMPVSDPEEEVSMPKPVRRK